MAEEAPQQLRRPGQASPLATHVGVDVLDGVRSEVGEAAVLEVAPEQLYGVEFWCVGRQPDEVEARPPARRARGGAGGSGRGPRAG